MEPEPSFTYLQEATFEGKARGFPQYEPHVYLPEDFKYKHKNDFHWCPDWVTQRSLNEINNYYHTQDMQSCGPQYKFFPQEPYKHNPTFSCPLNQPVHYQNQSKSTLQSKHPHPPHSLKLPMNKQLKVKVWNVTINHSDAGVSSLLHSGMCNADVVDEFFISSIEQDDMLIRGSKKVQNKFKALEKLSTMNNSNANNTLFGYTIRKQITKLSKEITDGMDRINKCLIESRHHKHKVQGHMNSIHSRLQRMDGELNEFKHKFERNKYKPNFAPPASSSNDLA